jgi:hypothetical protein
VVCTWYATWYLRAGNLRNHPLAADGSDRDTVVFSISGFEWMAGRNNLRVWLQRDPA